MMSVSVRRRLGRALTYCCLGLLGMGTYPVQGANRADWWIYLANDDATAIRDLLAQGADPNERFDNGQPAIMKAVADRAWKVFDVLASDPRIELNIENPASETPLMYLAVSGQTERARQLIARGAEINRLGWTPLHYAASKGHLATTQLLLAHKAMVNAAAPDGTTPLMMAAYAGSRPVVQLLLRAGADPDTHNIKGQNAADWARAGKAENLAKELTLLIAKVERERETDAHPVAPAASTGATQGARYQAETSSLASQAGIKPVLGITGVHTDERNLPSGN